jgi:hypothetical protein
MRDAGGAEVMHNQQDDTGTLDHETPSWRRQHVLTLPAILAVGWLIYEVTAQPALAAMAMCLKFGWDDYLTAHWLRRTDPDRNRGRACYWLYASSGLWKVAITGLGMILLILALVTIIKVRGNQARQLLPMLAAAGFTLTIGFGLSALTSYYSVWLARKHRVRLWLNGAVARARQHNEWPPLYGWDNRVMVLMVTTMISTCLFLIPTVLVLFCLAFDQVIPDRAKAAVLGVGMLISLMFVLPMFWLKLREMTFRRFFAGHPADCWGSEEVVAGDGTEVKAVQ